MTRERVDMYLPTDAKTIYNVMIDRERASRDFWRQEAKNNPNRTDSDREVCERAAMTAHGRMWALYDLRDGSYIV
jgi:hypothetical protein